MATATEMTLTMGRTVYGGDPSGEADSDERIEGRETRVSVTWRLTEAEQNLPLMASVLAEEAERALASADRTVRRHPRTEVKTKEVETGQAQSLTPLNGVPANGVPSGTGSHLSETGIRPDGGAGQRFATGSANSAAQPGSETPRESNSPSPGNGYGTSGHPPSSPSYSRPYVPGITKTQQLAIQSYCNRHGVADWELRKLIWEQFGKKEQRELNKDEAGELLTALQQHMLSNGADHHNGADHPAYAN